ncbi:hypothetical protein AB0H37_41840 [Actinomadura sp. NPDC023710]|uniref:hypothetical protein n=1 Tax=Actinomadura sp. NPDC023710 TaxID=3158219 RepID=UPI00340B329A
MHQPELSPTGPNGLRTLVIVMVAVAIGIVVGALSLFADHAVPEVLLAASAATSSTADLLNQILPVCHPLPSPDDSEEEHPDDHTERHG